MLLHRIILAIIAVTLSCPTMANPVEQGGCRSNNGFVQNVYVENCRALALIIANPLVDPGVAYADPLLNGREDAELIARSLPQNFELVGGQVHIEKNYQEIIELFSSLRDRVEETSSEVVFVYLAGHGFQVHGENYVIPAEAPRPNPRDTPAVSYYNQNFIPISEIKRLMNGSVFNALVVNACRPQYNLGTRSGGGISAFVAQSEITHPNMFFLTSSHPGGYAYDTAPPTASPSPFAQEFSRLLQVENVSLLNSLAPMNRSISERTMDLERGEQRPWLAGSPKSIVFWRGDGSLDVESFIESPSDMESVLTSDDFPDGFPDWEIDEDLWRKADGPELAFATLFSYGSVAIIETYARSGVGDAAYVLAILYDGGLGGLSEDPDRARYWAQQAHNLGSLRGTAMLGYLAQKQGLVSEALALLGEAAEQGLVTAKAQLGANYLGLFGTSRITELNEDRGIAYLREAASAGHLFSINALFVRDDLRLQRDAYNWAVNEVTSGDPQAANWLCRMYQRRLTLWEGFDDIDKLRFETCQFAANSNQVYSQAILGSLYLFGTGIAQNDLLAREWGMRAASLINNDFAVQQDRLFVGVTGEGVLEETQKWIDHITSVTSG